MAISYSFTPGGSSLQTDNPVGNELYQYVRRFQQQQAPAPIKPNSSIATRADVDRLNAGGKGGERAMSPLDVAEMNARMAQLHAISGPAPLRTSFVAGQRVDTPDVNAMTGAQRNVFLPNASGMGGFGESRASLGPSSLGVNPGESSNSGFDYLPPLEQARYVNALRRMG